MTKWSIFVESVKAGYSTYKGLRTMLTQIDWSKVDGPIRITYGKELVIE